MIRTYLYLALALGIAGGAGWVGFEAGKGTGADAMAAADKKLVDRANQDALSARTELEAQQAQWALEQMKAAKREKLADELYADLSADATKTQQQLNASRKTIEALRHASKPVDDFLSIPVPLPLRDELCAQRGDQACGGVR